MSAPNDTLAQRLRIALPMLAGVVFLILGFAFHAWKFAWLVFLIVPVGYALLPRPDGRARPDRAARRADRRS